MRHSASSTPITPLQIHQQPWEGAHAGGLLCARIWLVLASEHLLVLGQDSWQRVFFWGPCSPLKRAKRSAAQHDWARVLRAA